MNEVQAAFGLLQLKHIHAAIARRRAIDTQYRTSLAGLSGISCLSPPPDTQGNYSYFPILVEDDYPLKRDELYHKLRDHGIYARRYFYPLISDMPMYRGLPSAAVSNLPNARRVAERVLCLPIYPTMEDSTLARVCQLIAEPVLQDD